MPTLETPLLILVAFAVAIGWVIGGAKRRTAKVSVDELPSSYMQSLTLLINAQPDEAMDKLISVFEVNEATFDTHIALGNVSRKQGELDRAIKIHQNLLSRPNLGRKHHDVAHFELAKDYLQAGLLDRAEVLLKELLEKKTAKHSQAQTLLISLYEDESEWQTAIAVAQELLPKRLLRQRTDADRKVALRIAHYYSELAELALTQSDYQQASQFIVQVFAYDKTSLRGSYLTARLAAAKGDSEAVLRVLPQILQKDSKLLFEALWLIDIATQGWASERMVSFIESLYAQTQSVQVLGLLIEHAPHERAETLIEQHLQTKPTLGAVSLWLKHSGALAEMNSDRRELLFNVLKGVQQAKKRYQCHICGFKGMQFFWHCPTCKEWDTMELLRGEDSASA